MAQFRIPKFEFERFQIKEEILHEKKKKTKIVPTTFAQIAACAENCSMAICPSCRPGPMFRQQIGSQGSCCACRSKITSKLPNKCGVGFACVGRGCSGLPCTIPEPPNPCPCTTCSCLPNPLPCGVVCLACGNK